MPIYIHTNIRVPNFVLLHRQNSSDSGEVCQNVLDVVSWYFLRNEDEAMKADVGKITPEMFISLLESTVRSGQHPSDLLRKEGMQPLKVPPYRDEGNLSAAQVSDSLAGDQLNFPPRVLNRGPALKLITTAVKDFPLIGGTISRISDEDWVRLVSYKGDLRGSFFPTMLKIFMSENVPMNKATFEFHRLLRLLPNKQIERAFLETLGVLEDEFESSGEALGHSKPGYLLRFQALASILTEAKEVVPKESFIQSIPDLEKGAEAFGSKLRYISVHTAFKKITDTLSVVPVVDHSEMTLEKLSYFVPLLAESLNLYLPPMFAQRFKENWQKKRDYIQQAKTEFVWIRNISLFLATYGASVPMVLHLKLITCVEALFEILTEEPQKEE